MSSPQSKLEYIVYTILNILWQNGYLSKMYLMLAQNIILPRIREIDNRTANEILEALKQALK